MVGPLDIIIVEKSGSLKLLCVKDFKIEELYKKCGFKKYCDFLKHCYWNIKLDGIKYHIELYGKVNGKANSENKYEFPPPIDNTLFFGSCALVLQKYDNNNLIYTNFTLNLWNKIYEKLYGGFEDLSATAKEDEEEIDELQFIPKKYKTKQGYLKDGFVVDDAIDDDETDNNSINSNLENKNDDNDNNDDNEFIIKIPKKSANIKKINSKVNDITNTLEKLDNNIIDEIGSELTEEYYDYE
jgi:hypothetical protein